MFSFFSILQLSYLGLTFNCPFTTFSLQWWISAKQSNILAITFPSGSQGGQIFLIVCCWVQQPSLFVLYHRADGLFPNHPICFDKSWRHSSHAMKSKDLAYWVQLCILFYTIKLFTLHSCRVSSVFYNQKFMLPPRTFGFSSRRTKTVTGMLPYQ